jgi:FMN-dependent NADH-azoreductase
VNEAWIAAAYIDPAGHTPAMRAALHESETLIAEIARVDTVVIGAPMYNFGMPAQLKAYFDQVVRVGRTFAFEATADEPYRPLLIPRPVVVITSAGDGAVHPGGALEHLNFLEPHLKAILGFIGLTDVSFVRAGYDEFQDHRTRRSLASAEAAVDQLLNRLFPESTLQLQPGLVA